MAISGLRVEKQAAANRRPEGIQYAKLSRDIKFTEVDDKNVQPYPFTFYVHLSTMEDITVQDENQNDINLLTFHGEDEWATDTVQDEIDIVLMSQASIRKPFLLAPPSIDIIKSKDKLFFITYSRPDKHRKEWKLVQLDFECSMKLYPNCLQDGKFIVNFYIQHHNGDKLHITDRRFWLEYHQAEHSKMLSLNYHIIQPSKVSVQIASSRSLVPYREWVTLNPSDILLHGPFNVATKNNRKTRDRISQIDWDILTSQSTFVIKTTHLAITVT
eukprot:scaffold157897_cov33-Attheya_sp.AAC.1